MGHRKDLTRSRPEPRRRLSSSRSLPPATWHAAAYLRGGRLTPMALPMLMASRSPSPYLQPGRLRGRTPRSKRVTSSMTADTQDRNVLLQSLGQALPAACQSETLSVQAESVESSSPTLGQALLATKSKQCWHGTKSPTTELLLAHRPPSTNTRRNNLRLNTTEGESRWPGSASPSRAARCS